MDTIVAEMRVHKTVASPVPLNADTKLEPDDKVRIYRESGRKYVGSYSISRIDKNQDDK